MTRTDRRRFREHNARVPRHRDCRLRRHYGILNRWHVFRCGSPLGYAQRHFLDTRIPHGPAALELGCTAWWSAHGPRGVMGLYPTRAEAVHMLLHPDNPIPW
jgi:hypothetical protein